MQKQNNTFWYDGPRDMLAKLDREIEALSKIGRLDNHRKADTVLNAAITAWQLADWVTSTITTVQRSRVETIFGDGIPLDQLFLSDLNLHICRQIATAGKHVEIKRHHDPYVQTKAALVFDFESAQPALEWMISVDHRDTHVTVKEVLGGARDFWSKFLNVMDGHQSTWY